MPLRYVILHHTGVERPHFDLMFETAPGSALATWRSPAWPITAPTRVERLPDHRREYLEYEGPLSNNRGEVRQVASGGFERSLKEADQERLILDQRITLRLNRQLNSPYWLVEVGQLR